jgi:hypothetical protein
MSGGFIKDTVRIGTLSAVMPIGLITATTGAFAYAPA